MVFLSQHKALYCYIVLLVWIVIIVFSVYNYLGGFENVRLYSPPLLSVQQREKYDNSYSESVYKSCNAPSTISMSDENIENGDNVRWRNNTLEGILVILRHGDRGPLYHVRNMANISCGNSIADGKQYDDALYRNYKSFFSSSSRNRNNNKANTLDFFNTYFADLSLPKTERCELGQLTDVGIRQLLKLGALMKGCYYDRLIIRSNGSFDITLYSTKYKRTLLSATAFLYGFLQPEDLLKIKFEEVYSISYCFEDCACPMTDYYKKAFLADNSKRLKSHPTIFKLIQQVSSIIFASPPAQPNDPYSVKDALLCYVCHGERLPCSDIYEQCIQPDQVKRIFTYIDWEIGQYGKMRSFRKYSALKAYGLLKNIISHLLKMVSSDGGNQPKLVVYSAHDKTIQLLLTTFSIFTEGAMNPVYASRLIFEVYRDGTGLTKSNIPSVKHYYFRLVYNGEDITKRLKFCHSKKLRRGRLFNRVVDDVNKMSSHYLCSLESVIRFLHDNYFAIFNSTNFKDSCDYKLFKPPVVIPPS